MKSLRWMDARPESSSLPANNNHGRNGCNFKHSTSERKDKIVPPTEKEIDNLTIPALKDELAKRDLSKREPINSGFPIEVILSKYPHVQSLTKLILRLCVPHETKPTT